MCRVLWSPAFSGLQLTCKAAEHKRVEGLSDTLLPGTKVCITAAPIRNGVVMLEPKCIKVRAHTHTHTHTRTHTHTHAPHTPQKRPCVPCPVPIHKAHLPVCMGVCVLTWYVMCLHVSLQVLGGRVETLAADCEFQRKFANVDRSKAGSGVAGAGGGGESAPPFRHFVPGECV